MDTVWRTVTKTSLPLRPCFGSMDTIRDSRRISSPTRSGRLNSILPPAHMRRGSSTGGRNPPRFG